MDIFVGEGFWTIDRWNRCGIRSNPGSVGLSGGRIRTAVSEVSSVLGKTDAILLTNFDGSLCIFVRGSTSTSSFTRHAHPAISSRLTHHCTRWSLGDARWRSRRRGCHLSSDFVRCDKTEEVDNWKGTTRYGSANPTALRNCFANSVCARVCYQNNNINCPTPLICCRVDVQFEIKVSRTRFLLQIVGSCRSGRWGYREIQRLLRGTYRMYMQKSEGFLWECGATWIYRYGEGIEWLGGTGVWYCRVIIIGGRGRCEMKKKKITTWFTKWPITEKHSLFNIIGFFPI